MVDKNAARGCLDCSDSNSLEANRRSFIKAGGAALSATFLAGCLGGAGSEDSEFDLTLGIPFASETLDTEMLRRFVDQVENRTDGEITGSVLPQQIGNAGDHVDAAAFGSIDMYGQSAANLLTDYAPEYAFVVTPFVTEDWDHHLEIYQQYIEPTDELNGIIIESANQRLIGTGLHGARHITGTEAYRSPEDLEGITMRTPPIDSWTRVWEGLGANPTPIEFDELYQSLQTGVVDATEDPVEIVFDSSLYEVQTHISLLGHTMTDTTVAINEDTWQSFSADQQEIVQDSLNEELQWLTEEKQNREDEFLQELEEEHEFTVVEDIDSSAFEEAAEEVLREMDDEWAVSYDDI